MDKLVGGYASDSSFDSSVVGPRPNSRNKPTWPTEAGPQSKPSIKRKRIREDDPTKDSFLGPWGGYEPVASAPSQTTSISQTLGQLKPNTPTHEPSSLLPNRYTPKETAPSLLPGWSSLSLDDHPRTLALPKRCVHTYEPHASAVQRVRFSPYSGRYILTSSLDGTCRILDYSRERSLISSYSHPKAVRDADYIPGNPAQFFSACFDSTIKLWDVEKVDLISTVSLPALPFCVAAHPQQPFSLVAGLQNRNAVQIDLRSNKISQTYHGHMGAVSSITFLDGKRFLTTSDDRRLHIYNFGIDLVDRYLAEPGMQSIPAAAMVNGLWVGQRMDNCLVGYDPATLKLKKKFSGHANSGYSIQPCSSPDGKFLVSGGSNGDLHFWDWKTQQMVKTINAAHGSALVATEWHPNGGGLVTCGWDGLVKLWDS